MMNRSRTVAYGGRLFYAVLAAICLMNVAPEITAAKSLYVIAQNINLNGPLPLNAYNIGPGGILTFQTHYGIKSVAGGAVGITIDSNSGSLFITYEFTNEIRVVNAVTMNEELVAVAQNAVDLAGIVYDHDKGLLYAVDRGEPNLYAYHWDRNAGQLNIVQGSPFKLKGAQSYGIALDEIEDQLYVGGPVREVLVYNTANWSLVRTITLRRTAISVAVDARRRYLYTGGGYVGNFYLTQYNLDTGTETEVQVDPEAGVMGLAVDPATGFIYATDGQDNKPGGNDLLVYDTTLRRIQIIEDIGDATGVVIPGKEVSYNPLNLVKTIEEDSGSPSLGVVPEVPIGSEFTYDVCFDHDGYALTDVVITDILPPEVTFVRADGDGAFGSYDAQTHTYTWHDPPLSAGPRTCLKLVTQVKPEITVGSLVVNSVTIDTAQTPPTTVTVDAVATVVVAPFKPLNLTKSIIAGVDANDPTGVAHARPGDRVTYRLCYDNHANTQAVSNVTLVDALPGDVSFVSTSDRSGQYSSATHTCTWSFPSLAAGAAACVDVVVQLGSDVPGGTVITNHATLDSDETTATSASVMLVAGSDSLQVTKTIKSGAVADAKVPGRLLVNPGANLTYEICIANPSSTRTLTRLSLVDILPAHTTFVSAEREREIGYYDAKTIPTFTWVYGSLAPGAQDCLDLVVHVDEQTEPNTVITNSLTVSGTEMTSVTTKVDVVVSKPTEPVTQIVLCDLLVKPTKLYRDQHPQRTSFMAVLHLPEGIGYQMIANQPLVLTPGNIASLNEGRRVFGTTTAGAIMAFFDPQALLSATAVNGSLTVKVTGKLTDGRSFQGWQNIEIHQSSK